MPDFNVQNAQFICPAADLSEQIPTAGKEASGTGNMRFMMNGALTIGTLDGALTRGDTGVLRPVVENLLQADPFMVLADCAAHVACQARVSAAWREPERGTRMSIFNTARSGKFSSDRAVREYCDKIWLVPAVRVALD